MAETRAEYLARYGRPDGRYPVVDLDSADHPRHTVIVTYAGEAKKAMVQFVGLCAGHDNEHLGLDEPAFVDEAVARSSVFGIENGRRCQGFDEAAPSRSRGWPAVHGVSVLIDTTAQD